MRLRQQYLALALIALTASGCALFQSKTEPVPVQTEVQQLQELDQIVTVAEAIVDSVGSVQKGEDTLYDLRKQDGGRYITPKQHEDAADVFAAFAREAKPLLVTVKDLANSPQTRRSAADKLLTLGKDTLARLAKLSPGTVGYVETALGLIKALVLPRL